MDGTHFCIGIRGEESKQLVLALNRIGLCATASMPCRPDAGEECQRAIFVEGEPGRRLARLGVGVFAEGVERHDTAMGDIQPGAPMRTGRVADVGDGRTTKLRRSRHAPTGQHELAYAIRRIANNRGRIVGKDARHRRQIAGPIAHGAGERDDRRLAFGDRVEVAHRTILPLRDGEANAAGKPAKNPRFPGVLNIPLTPSTRERM
jgi:hypothetical protein